ncbi:uncharacterized protein APUU_61101S [Aspergillus puulaauensis]|uniref:Uncharacterized protein n=1 Tax=Aspergillus puulaauensis TaxID=1220207 RepID=A0A7R7XW52_9EURO|nr:uncharacterized protein APUU_61101S [Aspergillus puulaauensis]BCS28053.1 hypothetical protein APUU_61101S [Aspergillus puulaauensis]
MSEPPIWLLWRPGPRTGQSRPRAWTPTHRVVAEPVQEITSQGGHWIALGTTADNLEEIVTHAEAIYGYFDIVVNNAGTTRLLTCLIQPDLTPAAT